MVDRSEANRREYFRLGLPAIPGLMNIIEIGQRPITTNARTVSILNAGGGGLLVLAEDDLPIRRGVVAQFTFEVGQHSFAFRGILVRKLDDRTSYEYGVRFIDVDEYQRGLLLSALGRLQVELVRTGG
jgi:c-di-GMP-binding flagellar brake protein YcgR